MIDTLLKTTVIFVVASLVAALLRRSSAAARHAIWLVALASALILPVLETALPPLETPILLRADAALGGDAGAGRSGGVNWLYWIWATGTAVLLIRLAAGHARMAWVTRGAGRLVRRTKSMSVPMTWGFRRAVVLVPRDFSVWPRTRRHAALRHEIAHIRRWDCLWQLVARVACSLYWFHPLAWVALRRLQEESERAADDRALACLRPAEYAAGLVDVARSFAPAPAAAVGMARPSALESRVRAILDPRVNRRPAGGLTLAAVAAATVALVLPLAALQDDKTYKIGDGVKAPRLIFKVEPKYTEEAREAKISGTVVLSTVITPDGKAAETKVTKSLDKGLDEKAIEAVQQWRFEPGTKDGKPVRVAATIEVNFRLQ